jgi:MarR family 2-MHQ and catechol resistance regulon transcriptional repressor
MPTHYKGTSEQIRALDTFIKLNRATSALEASILAHGTIQGLTLSQFGVLEALYHLGPLCQGEVSRKLMKSTGNMTLVLDNLEKAGLVRRVRSAEDRRMIRIELTIKGHEVIEHVLPLHVAVITEEISVLSPAEQAELGRLLRKLEGEKRNFWGSRGRLASTATPTPKKFMRRKRAKDVCRTSL